MGNLSFDFEVESDPETTYEIVRDQLPAIIQSIPIVNHSERVDVQQNDVEKIEDCWNVSVSSALPNFISSIITIDDLLVKSTSVWKDEVTKIDFDLVIENWERLLTNCEGEIKLLRAGSSTEMDVTCSFDISLSQVPGLPDFMARRFSGKLSDLAEKHVIKYIPDIKKSLNQHLPNSNPKIRQSD